MIILDTPEQIARARLLTLKQALWLETKGLTRRGRSAYAIVKSEFGFRGGKLKVFEQLEAMINES